MAATAWSSTWSPTSTRSSTSDGPSAPGPAVGPAAVSSALAALRAGRLEPARLAAAARVVHPFPSLLDGAVVALVAVMAGGGWGTAVVLGLSMTALQFAIGAVNDLVDAPSDAGRKPGKPIPAGHVTVGEARLVATGSAVIGLALALAGGPGLVALAVAGLLIGLAYDRWAKGTSVSWLPLAAGIPLLPVFGWYGAAGELPGLFVVLVPAAANAGTALAISNAVVDMERDEAAGQRSIALALGGRGASLLAMGLHAVAVLLALATTAYVGAPAGWVLAVLGAALAPLGGAALGIVAADRPGTALRELGWEVQALGTALLAVAWLAALGASGGLGPV